MKKNLLLTIACCGAMFATTGVANAQEETVIVEETVVTTQTVPCKTHYSASWRDNWFIQAGAGAQVPFMEKWLANDKDKHHFTAVYNIGAGRWFSPYLGFRFSGYYGQIRWDYINRNKAKTANLNLDLMWDMTNSIGGYNPTRVFSFIPFIGVGGAFTWDFTGYNPMVKKTDQGFKGNEWTLPVSAGFQMRFRLCKYVDFFAEVRGQFFGDNFNRVADGEPIDVNISAIGGFNFNIGAREFQAYNPCDYLGYINDLNGRVNELRGALAATTAALAVAEAQLPCPEVVAVQQPEVVEVATPLLSTVRFKINSAKISSEEMVNVYNVAQYLKENPNATITINGYADKDTGSAKYNMNLSNRRAQAVADVLTGKYGISADRLTVKANGSAEQPYGVNNWNRIVIFAQP